MKSNDHFVIKNVEKFLKSGGPNVSALNADVEPKLFSDFKPDQNHFELNIIFGFDFQNHFHFIYFGKTLYIPS